MAGVGAQARVWTAGNDERQPALEAQRMGMRIKRVQICGARERGAEQLTIKGLQFVRAEAQKETQLSDEIVAPADGALVHAQLERNGRGVHDSLRLHVDSELIIICIIECLLLDSTRLQPEGLLAQYDLFTVVSFLRVTLRVLIFMFMVSMSASYHTDSDWT